MRNRLSRIAAAAAAMMVSAAAVAAINTYTFWDSSRGDVPFNVLPIRLSLTDAKSDLGVPMTASAGTPSGTVGVDRGAGTVLALVGESTSGGAKTDKAIWEFELGPTYGAGNPITVTVNAGVQGNGTFTASTTMMTLTAYSEVNGVETALTVSAAQQIPATAADLTFTITGTTLTTRARIVVEATMLVTSSANSNSGIINRVDVSY